MGTLSTSRTTLWAFFKTFIEVSAYVRVFSFLRDWGLGIRPDDPPVPSGLVCLVPQPKSCIVDFDLDTAGKPCQNMPLRESAQRAYALVDQCRNEEGDVMNDFKKRMLLAAINAGLAVIGSLMNSQQAVAQQGPPDGLAVRIVNPVPVPVTGSTTVSGTVAATQSGTWNVGISGTPNVGITGTPNVKVTNPATAPVLTLDLSKSASQHVELRCGNVGFANDFNNCVDPITRNIYVVPAGQNLIVTSVDINPKAGGGPISSVQIGTGYLSVQPHGGLWFVPTDGVTHSFQYPSGILFPAGFTFDQSNLSFVPNSLVSLRGFLTSF
jgi:hypothetical protein